MDPITGRFKLSGFGRLKIGKVYGSKSKLLRRLDERNSSDDITGLELWQGLRFDMYDEFAVLSYRYTRDGYQEYSARLVFSGYPVLSKKGKIKDFKAQDLIKRTHEVDEVESVERVNFYAEKSTYDLVSLRKGSGFEEVREITFSAGNKQLDELTPGVYRPFYETDWHQDLFA